MGSHVLRHVLSTTDWEIVGIDSFQHKGKTDRITQQLEGQDANRVTILVHDLTVPISKQLDIKIGHIDYVLNIASESHVDRSIESPREFIHNNTELILTMLEWLKTRNTNEYYLPFVGKVEKFVQISTDEVYGPAPKGKNHKEGEPHKPSNPYSASKAAQENICYAYWRTYGLPIIITNTMNIIGEMQDPEKYIPKAIKAINSGEELTIHGNEDGSKIGSRYYLHARNQADALVFILKRVLVNSHSNGQEINRFNIVGEVETDNLELASLIAGYVGKPLFYKVVDFHSSRPGHDLRYALDGTSLKSIGWKAPLTFEESLKTTVEWTLEHPEWLED